VTCAQLPQHSIRNAIAHPELGSYLLGTKEEWLPPNRKWSRVAPQLRGSKVPAWRMSPRMPANFPVPPVMGPTNVKVDFPDPSL
jgi:hypothetical protein